MSPDQPKLDHFLFYDAANQQAGQVIGLQGQFDKQPEKVQLRDLNVFANWVKKNNEPVYNKNAHFTWYDLFDPVPDPVRAVVLKNQFGEQKIYTGRTMALLAPAWKVEKGSVFPKGLDHYKVYQVLQGEPVNKAVALEDQFGKQKVQVYYPYAFAVPVVKWHQGQVTKIVNKRDHLLLYRITPGGVQKAVPVVDQFGKRYVNVFRSVLLGVPSVKGKWEEQ